MPGQNHSLFDENTQDIELFISQCFLNRVPANQSKNILVRFDPWMLEAIDQLREDKFSQYSSVSGVFRNTKARNSNFLFLTVCEAIYQRFTADEINAFKAKYQPENQND